MELGPIKGSKVSCSSWPRSGPCEPRTLPAMGVPDSAWSPSPSFAADSQASPQPPLPRLGDATMSCADPGRVSESKRLGCWRWIPVNGSGDESVGKGRSGFVCPDLPDLPEHPDLLLRPDSGRPGRPLPRFPVVAQVSARRSRHPAIANPRLAASHWIPVRSGTGHESFRRASILH